MLRYIDLVTSFTLFKQVKSFTLFKQCFPCDQCHGFRARTIRKCLWKDNSQKWVPSWESVQNYLRPWVTCGLWDCWMQATTWADEDIVGICNLAMSTEHNIRLSVCCREKYNVRISDSIKITCSSDL